MLKSVSCTHKSVLSIHHNTLTVNMRKVALRVFVKLQIPMTFCCDLIVTQPQIIPFIHDGLVATVRHRPIIRDIIGLGCNQEQRCGAQRWRSHLQPVGFNPGSFWKFYEHHIRKRILMGD